MQNEYICNMRDVIRTVAFQLMLLYILSLGIYSSAVIPHRDYLPAHNNSEQYFALPSLSSPLYGVQPQLAGIDIAGFAQNSIKLPSNVHSIHSPAADEVVSLQSSEYIQRNSLVLIYPQLFDMLFPFHYYS